MGASLRTAPLLLVLCASVAAVASEPPRALSFEQRVAAERAIERVRFSHRTGERRSFEEARPREQSERNVRDYLARTVLLAERWGVRVTGEMLRDEVARMARSSGSPARLAELFAALGGDALLVEECLARPILVDRLTRERFAGDAWIHARSREAAESLRDALLDGTIDPRAEHPSRTVFDLEIADGDARTVRRPVRRDEAPPARPRARGMRLDPVAFARLRAELGETRGSVGALGEGLEAFAFRVVLDERPGHLRLASYSVRKRAWDDWWREVAGEYRNRAVALPAPDGEPPPVPPLPAPGASVEADCPEWVAAVTGPLGSRYGHTAVWTGSEMVVWGGHDLSTTLASGACYDPATDSWSSTSMTDAPTPRSGHTAVWDGSEMIVWGGTDAGFLDSGARYDPTTDRWSPTSATDAPSARTGHTAVWTGDEMIVWGGNPIDPPSVAPQGGRYDPATDGWAPTSPIGAPEARALHTAVWTGSEMIVWGGQGWDEEVNSGARYDPAADAWSGTNASGAPAPREWHTAVWTGDEMVVWGGRGPEGYLDTGGRYDPLADVWTPTASTGAPAPRYLATAVWTGDAMVVWGGSGGAGQFLGTGGNYDPVGDRWSANDTAGVPAGRDWHTAVWTGGEMIVWGGMIGSATSTNSGARYAAGLNADADGDGLSECAGDCDDADGQIWLIPGAVDDLRFVDAQSMLWSPPADPGGSQLVYDALRAGAALDFDQAVCLETDDGSDTSATDAGPPPPAGSLYFYQVRAENDCPGAVPVGASCP